MVLSSFAPILVNNLPIEMDTKNVTIKEVSPIIVMFGSSPEELAAKNQVLVNFPNSIVIDFNDIEMIYKNSNPIIYIGHSSKEGIGYYDQIIEWDKIAYIIENSISNDHFILGCDSKTISSLTSSTGKNIVSFNQEIDAIYGALIVTISIVSKLKLGQEIVFYFLRKALTRMIEVTLNPELSLPLVLKGQEIYTMGYLFFALIGTLYPLTGLALGITGAIFVTTSLSVIAALFNLVDFAKNGGDAGVIVLSLSVIVKFMYQILKSQILKLPWWKQASGFSSLSADTAKNAIASVIVVLAVAVALVSLVYYMTLFLYDVIDADNTYW